MIKSVISIIAAMDEKRGIGRDNKLLWHIPEDLKRFKTLTFGHPIIMGRKTFDSIGKPLPGRTNIVITRDTTKEIPGCIVVHSLGEAITEAKKENPNEIFVIGGAQIYQQTIGMSNKLYLTIVHHIFEADTFFPDYSEFIVELKKENHESKEYKYIFLDLVRPKNSP